MLDTTQLVLAPTPEQYATLQHRIYTLGHEVVETHQITTDDMERWISPPEWAGVGTFQLTFKHGASYIEGYLSIDGRWFPIR